MKRMNILLGRHTLLECFVIFCVFTIGGPLYVHFLCTVFKQPIDTGWYPFEFLIFFALSVFVMLLTFHRLPLYLEYDDEKIVAHYPFGITATVRKDQTIYIGKLHIGKSNYQFLYSNTPFSVSVREFTDNITPTSFFYTDTLDRKTQITLPINAYPEAHALFPRELCLAAEKVDWDVLTEQYKSRPAQHSATQKIRLIPGYTSFLHIFPISFGRNTTDFRTHAVISIGEHTVETRLFNKTLCTVNLNETVYYAVFRSREFGTTGAPYIVVSNAWFNYYTVNRADRSYLSEYPLETQVAFPYNAETAPICDFENWHCVGGFAELNLQRKPNTTNKNT